MVKLRLRVLNDTMTEMFEYLRDNGQGHFVGVYLVFKLYMLHGNIPVTALLLSPVHLWMEIVNVGLLIREVAFGVWCKDAKDKYVNYESFDTIAVANSTWSVCNKHAKYHYRPSSVKY